MGYEKSFLWYQKLQTFEKKAEKIGLGSFKDYPTQLYEQ